MIEKIMFLTTEVDVKSNGSLPSFFIKNRCLGSDYYEEKKRVFFNIGYFFLTCWVVLHMGSSHS